MSLPRLRPQAVVQVRSIVDLHWRDWGETSVVLESRSGQIHECDPLSAAVMACVEDNPASAAEIARVLASDVTLEADVEFEQQVADILQHFLQLGWIEPLSRT